MKIDSREIEWLLVDTWPYIGPYGIIVADRAYWCPSVNKLESLLHENKLDREIYLPDINDCDDFALQLNADIKRVRSRNAALKTIPQDEWFPFAFGEAYGTRFRGEKYYHAINICVTKQGLRLIEPQTDEIWVPDKDKDTVVFIRI